MTSLKIAKARKGGKRTSASRGQDVLLRYAAWDRALEPADLRLHLLFLHEAWARGSDRVRLGLLRSYLDYLADPRNPPTRDIIVLPAGFHREGDPDAVRREMEAELAGYLTRPVLIGAGIDTPAPNCREFSYLLDLATGSAQWPVVIQKFNREEPHGNPEDPRSCVWQGLEVFALCCFDCTCGLWAEPPSSLSWARDAGFHVVIDNAHYSGDRGHGLWEVGHAGSLTRGLGKMVRRPDVTGGGAGLAAVAFYTNRSPFERTGRWWYRTPAGFRARTLDFPTGEGRAAVWHRVVHVDL